MSEHLQQARLLELGLGEAPSSSEQAHLAACSSCRTLVTEELELGALIASASTVVLPDQFVHRTAARFEQALAWRRFAAVFFVLMFSCAPGGVLVWLLAVRFHRVLDWMLDLVTATSAVLRASSALATTLPMTTALVLFCMIVTCLLSAYALNLMVRRSVPVKYRATARVH
ncbi:MAG: hypothetical protein MUC50_04420 [Myxococcota bacterium]|jgi:hypothetical protein|nr:hypothetical protein [Myxococcota bacterium]